MPAGGIHLCVAKSVAKRMGLNESMSFLIGNVAHVFFPPLGENSASTFAGKQRSNKF